MKTGLLTLDTKTADKQITKTI